MLEFYDFEKHGWMREGAHQSWTIITSLSSLMMGSKNRSHEKNNLFESIHTSVEYGVCLPKHATWSRSSTYILQLLQKLSVEKFSSIKLVSNFASSIIA
jgi:hypothetical protein